MNVKVGDRVTGPNGDPLTVREIDGGIVRLSHGSCSLSYATSHKIREESVTSEYPYGDPFPTGSIVQFKRTRYVVDGFDGEHHDLTPENGDVEGRLYFSPDFFELVQPPFPSLHEVWEDRNGVRYYVKSVNEDDNGVRISRFDGPDIIITVQQLHAGYTKLL